MFYSTCKQETFTQCWVKVGAPSTTLANINPAMVERLVCRFEACTHSLIFRPVKKIHWPNVGSMLGHRLRRWPSIEPTVDQCIVFAGRCALWWNCHNNMKSCVQSHAKCASDDEAKVSDAGSMPDHRRRHWATFTGLCIANYRSLYWKRPLLTRWTLITP